VSTSAGNIRTDVARDDAPVVVVTTAEGKPKSDRAKLVDELLAIRRRAIAKGLQLKTLDEIRSDIEAFRDFDI
jgi:hypothetical protein